MKKIAFLLLAMLGFTAAACNTIKGAGEDIEATGENITEAADEAEDDITDGQ